MILNAERHRPLAALQDMEQERDRSRKKEVELAGRRLPTAIFFLAMAACQELRCCTLAELAQDLPGRCRDRSKWMLTVFVAGDSGSLVGSACSILAICAREVLLAATAVPREVKP